MSAQTALVLADGQTTPVNKTFSSRGIKGDTALYLDVSSGVGLGLPKLLISYNQSPGTNGATRVKARISLPVMEVISGADGGYTPVPKVAFEVFGKIEFTLPNRASAQNRKDILAFAKNLLGHTVATETVVNFDPPN